MEPDVPKIDMQVNTDDLYIEEVFTDRKVGTIRRLTPVDADGEKDNSRPVLYIGATQILTPMGAIPLTFELEGETLSEVCAAFPEAAQRAIEQTIEEAKELRRQSASSIVIPESGGMGGPGGMPGGGKIQIP